MTLNPSSTETTASVGSGIGTIAVYANVEGAKVYFDNDYEGSISNGVLMASIHVTGKPLPDVPDRGPRLHDGNRFNNQTPGSR